MLTVVYHTDLATRTSGYFFLEFDGPMYDASSGNKMRRWFLLNIWVSVRCDSASYKRLNSVLLRGIDERYAIHKLCCIVVSKLLGVYDL